MRGERPIKKFSERGVPLKYSLSFSIFHSLRSMRPGHRQTGHRITHRNVERPNHEASVSGNMVIYPGNDWSENSIYFVNEASTCLVTNFSLHQLNPLQHLANIPVFQFVSVSMWTSGHIHRDESWTEHGGHREVKASRYMILYAPLLLALGVTGWSSLQQERKETDGSFNKRNACMPTKHTHTLRQPHTPGGLEFHFAWSVLAGLDSVLQSHSHGASATDVQDPVVWLDAAFLTGRWTRNHLQTVDPLPFAAYTTRQLYTWEMCSLGAKQKKKEWHEDIRSKQLNVFHCKVFAMVCPNEHHPDIRNIYRQNGWNCNRARFSCICYAQQVSS